MKTANKYWFEANKDSPGWHPINRAGKIADTVSILFIFFAILGAVSWDLTFLFIYIAIVISANVLLYKLKAEPNPRNQIFRRYWERRKNKNSKPREATFYIYFELTNKSKANKLKKLLTDKQFNVDLHRIENQWSLVISKLLRDYSELKATQKELESLANEYSGEYDGHEFEL